MGRWATPEWPFLSISLLVSFSLLVASAAHARISVLAMISIAAAWLVDRSPLRSRDFARDTSISREFKRYRDSYSLVSRKGEEIAFVHPMAVLDGRGSRRRRRLGINSMIVSRLADVSCQVCSRIDFAENFRDAFPVSLTIIRLVQLIWMQIIFLT